MKEFGMVECKSIGTLMEVGMKVSIEASSPLADEEKYTRLVGSLNLLVEHMTRHQLCN